MNIQGVRELWIGVVQQAIEDYHKDPLVSERRVEQFRIKNLKESAGHWLFRSKLYGPGSLSWICENTDLSKNYIRAIARIRPEI